MSAVADAFPQLQALDTDVIAISVDSQFVHKIWFEEELSKMVPDIPFPLASDGGGHIGRLYGVYDEAGGVNIRGRFLIDPDGVVQAMEVMTPPVGRAIGETMIVAVAAGAGSNFTFNPFEAAETMTGHIVRISGGDLSYDSIDYNSIFAIGLTLFAMTLSLNVISQRIVRRFREVYE